VVNHKKTNQILHKELNICVLNQLIVFIPQQQMSIDTFSNHLSRLVNIDETIHTDVMKYKCEINHLFPLDRRKNYIQINNRLIYKN